MTNFDTEACNDLIISDVEAKEIALQLSGHGLRPKSVRKQQQQEEHEAKDMDAAAISYLQATYSRLQENQVRQLNDIFARADGEENASAKRVKRRLKKMEVVDDDVEEQNALSENCEVNDLTREMQGMQFGENNNNDSLRPIITFTPDHTCGGERELQNCRRVSPCSSFSDHASSGSSSPLLEVPMCEFQTMTAEMMRPPLN